MKWQQKHVGMVHYCSYWRKYSLILEVDGTRIVELDSFGGVNEPTIIREHSTCLEPNDRFLTMAEFMVERVSRL